MFCKYCGRKLEDGEVCNCRLQKKVQPAQPVSQKPPVQTGQTPQRQTPQTGQTPQWQTPQTEQTPHRQAYQPEQTPPQPQPLYEYEPEEQKTPKKSHKGLIIGLIAAGAVLVAAAAAAAVILLYGSGDKKPPKAVQTETETEDIAAEADTEMQTGVIPETVETEAENSVVAKLKEDYDAGTLDYVQLKKELAGIDAANLSETDAQMGFELQLQAENELTKQIELLVSESKYMEAFSMLAAISEALPEDMLVAELKKKYEVDFILYLEAESKKLVQDKKTEEAVKLLTEAKDYVANKALIDGLIESAQKAPKEADYIIPDSSSRYLTMDDVADLSLREINYAKNEIYARHGRRFASKELQDYFDSKSWYSGTIDANDFSSSVFNEYEKANADFLSEVEFSIDSAGYKLDAG